MGIRHSLANKKRWANPEYKEKLKEAISLGREGKLTGKDHPMYGLHHSERSKEKIRNSNYHKNLKGNNSMEKHGLWKGDDASYNAIHIWITNNFGKPILCEKCGNTKKIEWSKKDYKYKRERKDWQTLCRSCHRRYDAKQK